MLLSLHAGLDFSGRASHDPKQSDYFIACLVALEDEGQLKVHFDGLKQKIYGNTTTELHGKKMLPVHLADALKIGIALNMKVAALCIDKAATHTLGTLPPAQDFYRLTALKIWDDLLIGTPILRLTYDTEIEGKDQQKRFETEIKRRSSSVYPAQKIKVKSLPSHKSDLIQLADIVAYELSRQFNNKKVEPEIKALMRQIRSDSRNVIRGPQIWMP